MKKIRKPADLAVFGASPAFPEPLHVGRPNVGNRREFLRRVESILDSLWFSNNGPMVRELEKRLADYLGVRHCIAICNGTVALEIAVRALRLKGEVIIPSFTFAATAHALQWQEITPVFADIDAETCTLDPASVVRMITPRTSAILGVHVWGRPCDIDRLQEIADEHDLKLMFDAAHAFGCSYGGRMIGNFGMCEVLSFHATKFFNTFEGGAIVTNDDLLAEQLRLMRNFGFRGVDNVVALGINGKMPEICAAMGLTGLDVIEDTIAVNRANYECYEEELSNVPGLHLIRHSATERTNYQYVVARVAGDFPIARDDLVRILHAENILIRRYFYPGCHEMEPYRSLSADTATLLPNTVRLCNEVVSFPTGAAIDRGHIATIGELLRFIAANGAEILSHGLAAA